MNVVHLPGFCVTFLEAQCQQKGSVVHAVLVSIKIKFRKSLCKPAKMQGQGLSIDPVQLTGFFYPLHHVELPECFWALKTVHSWGISAKCCDGEGKKG